MSSDSIYNGDLQLQVSYPAIGVSINKLVFIFVLVAFFFKSTIYFQWIMVDSTPVTQIKIRNEIALNITNQVSTHTLHTLLFSKILFNNILFSN